LFLTDGDTPNIPLPLLSDGGAEAPACPDVRMCPLRLQLGAGDAHRRVSRRWRVTKTASHEDGESVGYYETKRRLTKLKRQDDHAWLYDVSSVVLQESVRNLERAFTNFFEGRAQYPRFKRKHGRQVAHYLKSAFTLSGDEKRPVVKRAKQSEPLDVRYSLDLPRESSGGEVKKLCVTKDPAGRYQISYLLYLR